MIDEQFLADPSRCPSCAAQLRAPAERCPACRIPLQGPTAARLWQVSQEASALLAERSRLLAALRTGASGPASPAYEETVAVTPAASAPAAPGTWTPTAPPAARRPEWTPRRVQNLLLALGVGLLGVAAVIFVAVSWGRLGVGGRAAVLTAVTVLSA
ncbi:MAG TPA: hypothetical protein VF423_03810, partial [Actinomycetes bacterium]